MSRCFPFPPSGYERKIKADDPSLLIKEKHREKNQKKEKKESKEKREKERTDEKRRDKKDKKEKHRDKKETNLNKDKHNGDALFPDEKKEVRPPDVYLHKSREKSKERVNGESITLGEKRVASPSVLNNGEPVSKNSQLASQTKIVKNFVGTDRRNTNEERKIYNQLPYKNVSSERPKDGGVTITGRDATPAVDGRKKTNEKPVVEKMDVLGVIGEAKFMGNAASQNDVGPVKLLGKSQGPLMDEREKKLEQKLEVRAKVSKEGDYKKGVKRKEENTEKLIHKHRDKEKRKEEKVKGASKVKNVQMPSRKNGSENHILTPNCKTENKKDLSATLSDGLQSIPKPISEGGASATLLGKRKDIGLNGIYDEHITGLNKLARTTASTHPLTVNGRSLEPCQNSPSLAARPPMNIKAERTFVPDESQRPPINNIKVDGKERKINDIKMQSSRKTSKGERKSEVSTKPPHPDTKYLSQVLAVPTLDECPELDDQEWLCSSNSSQTRKRLPETSGVEEEPKVWANALWLEPFDIFALPYVIPH